MNRLQAKHWLPLGWLCFFLVAPCLAQNQPVVQTGLHYYALVNTDNGQVVQRGTTGTQGVAFDQLILAPTTHYRIWVLQAATLLIGYIDITSPPAGGKIQLPQIQLGTDLSPDNDNDGLPNDAEFVVGSDPNNPSSCGNGILDGAMVRQGLDILNCHPVITGIIGNASTPGQAIDITAVNDIVITANQAAGVSVFNVFNAMSPKVMAQVITPGPALAVASFGNLVAVAAGSAGLVVIDITDPPAAKILQQVSLGGTAQAVAAAGGVAYVGLTSGNLVSVDMASGIVLDRLGLGTPVDDVAISGDAIYVLTDSTLKALPLLGGPLHLASSISAPGILPRSPARRRLFAGTTQAYAEHARGYTAFDLSNPLAPALIQDIVTAQVGWKQIVANGSGLALAAVGLNSTDDGPHDISLYALSPDGRTNQFITTFPSLTNGIATAVAIYNGQAYVATRAAGLEVINYLSYTNSGIPPTISLTTSFPLQPAQALEGQVVRVTAIVGSATQVRNVEFYVDGVKVFTDGNYPFEYHFVTPELGPSKTNFVLRARASDTAGNATWTDQITVGLLPNTIPPQVLGVSPIRGTILGAANSIEVFFNKPIVASSLNQSSFKLISAGPDKIFGTADDTVITNGVITYRADLNAAIMTFPTNLAPGLYEAIVSGAISDARGDLLPGPVRTVFGVLGWLDSDQDGLPDDWEIALGLDPHNPSTFNDGILDGLRDLSHDGLHVSWKIFWGYNPTNFSTFADGVSDGLRDPDKDGLNNIQEQAAGTNPFVADTDGDGWTDEQEVTAGSDPLDPKSVPKLLLLAEPVLSLVRPGSSEPGGLPVGVTLANPPASVVLPGISTVAGLLEGTTVANPAVGVVVPGFSAIAGFGLNATIAEPPVSVKYGP